MKEHKTDVETDDIALRPNEEWQYRNIRDYIENGKIASRKSVAKKLDCCEKTIDNMVKGYEAEGTAWFVHGNRGRRPVNALPDNQRKRIIKHYLKNYPDASFAHAAELLCEDNIADIHKSTVRSILMAQDIVSPYANHKTKSYFRKKLREQERAANKKEKAVIAGKMERTQKPRPKREKSASFGQMLQMDASQHPWFPESGRQHFLHAAIDDATGIVTGAWFDNQETLDAYYHITHQTLVNYGIPEMFMTDGRTVFEYRKRKTYYETTHEEVMKNSHTQFGYACQILGIDIFVTHVPESKGKIERLWETFQMRLPIDMRRARIKTMDEANRWLPSYIEKFNGKFALSPDGFPSLFVEAPCEEKINHILAVLTERTVLGGHVIRFRNQAYRTIGANGFPHYLPKKTKGMVVESFDKKLYFTAISPDMKENIYELEAIPEHEELDNTLGISAKKTPTQRKVNIPAANHPWRRDSWNRYLATQKQKTQMWIAN